MKNPYLKYKNQDARCGYPFEASPVGYCWGFATHIDEKSNPINFQMAFCLGCEFWGFGKLKARAKSSPNKRKGERHGKYYCGAVPFARPGRA